MPESAEHTTSGERGRTPWTFVPTVYFAEGLPYALVNMVSVVLYKRLGVDNASITFWTSLLYLPWVIKMFWGPVVDTNWTKRIWILATQACMCVCLLVIAAVLHLPGFFFISLAFFLIVAFVSATHDIAVDGYYMLALSVPDQSLFVGIRATFYRVAMVFGQGFLVWLAGSLEAATHAIPFSWSISIGLAALLFGVLALFHRVVLPFPSSDRRAGTTRGEGASAFVDVFRSYFRQKNIGVIIAFILCYRLGEASLLKLVSPFFLDSRTAGGLGLTTADVGIVYGTVGVGSLLLGGIVGGIVLKKYGLKRWLWPMGLIVNIPAFVYIFLSYNQPGVYVVAPMVFLEQFSYGFGFTAYMVYLMLAARGEYKTSHFAISTGIMALGMMAPGFVSGYLQELLGYRQFFVLAAVSGIPGLLTLFYLPLPEDAREGSTQE